MLDVARQRQPDPRDAQRRRASQSAGSAISPASRCRSAARRSPATDRINYTLRQPFGVVGRIIPFNHPLMFARRKMAAPLIAGNTVVLKPSEHTSLSALASPSSAPTSSRRAS